MSIQEKLTKIAEDMPKVYEAGVAEGKKSQYDEFWDTYQRNGLRTHYNGAFAGTGWDNASFKPKYPMRPTDARYMFYYGEKLELTEQVASIDFSKCKDFQGTFMSGPRYIDIVIDASGRDTEITLPNTFSYATVTRRIKKLIVDENVKYSTTFTQSHNLEEMIVDGAIGQNGFNVQWSTKLNRASIESIVNALSPNTTGLTVTLSKTAVNAAFETASGKKDGSESAEWIALISTKQNWTISLV